MRGIGIKSNGMEIRAELRKGMLFLVEFRTHTEAERLKHVQSVFWENVVVVDVV